MNKFVKYFTRRYLPRWTVLVIDLFIVLASWIFAYFLRFNLNIPDTKAAVDTLELLVIIPVFLISFLATKSFSGVLRHSTTKDIMNIISSMIIAAILLILISPIARMVHPSSFLFIPLSVIIIMIVVCTSILIISRLTAKLIFIEISGRKKEKKKIMIYGAGHLGNATRSALLFDSSSDINLVGFIDDNYALQKKYLAGVPIYSLNKALNKIIPEQKVAEIILAINQAKITHKRKREITDQFLNKQLIVREVPPVERWINGELKPQVIRKINIEDLLGRDAIKLDREKIRLGLQNSVVLVTGAAGSIGSEIVRQLISFDVKEVILIDIAESPLYDLQNEILTYRTNTHFNVIVGDITNETKLRRIFREYSPSIVFNAAAYKHVPLMEEFPCEAVRVNVGGTKILADLSLEFGVEKFVFISSDKAVNPTNVMGATKRISEIYIQALAQSKKYSTRFVTTRFGNVLGSNGSVVPLFKKQIERGGPVTVTHKDITRYFMTIPEACQLVLEAGFMGNGSEIFVFDMGEPVRIYDLAKRMILLSGYVPDKDIAINITNLRRGEKLYEELLDQKEELLPTHNDKILIAKVREHDYQTINKQILQLLENVDTKSRFELVEEMQKIATDYVSMNSYYPNGNGKDKKTGSDQKQKDSAGVTGKSTPAE